MSKKTLRKRLLARDANRCGIHTGGCSMLIQDGDEHDIDHIFPRAYTRNLPNRRAFDRPWNKQPMHRVCHEKRGVGQVIGGVEFTCTCHHTYLDESHDRYVVYLDSHTGVWKSVKFFSGTSTDRTPTPGSHRIGRPMTIVLGSSYRGILGYKKGKFGHFFTQLGTVDRIIHNMRELFRCFRWEELANEHQEFLRLRMNSRDGLLEMEVAERGGDFASAIAEYHMQRITLDFVKRYGVAEGRVKMATSILTGVDGLANFEIEKYMPHWDKEMKSAIQKALEIDHLKYAWYLLESGLVGVNNKDALKEFLNALQWQITQRESGG